MEDKNSKGKVEGKEEEEEEESLAIPEEKEIALQRGTTCLNCGVAFDREKVFCPQCGLGAGDAKLLPANTFISPIEQVARGIGILPLISLLLGILGPFFLGIGWILAIICGLLSLSAIRKRGGLPRDRKMALGGIALGFAWPLVLGSALLLVSHQRAIQRQISSNEASALTALKNIALTQRFAKFAFFFDRDNDGKSEYGTLADLGEINSPFFDPQLVTGEKSGYLFRMKHATEEGFRVLATPFIYGVTGRRTFSINQSGILRGEDIGEEGMREGKRLPTISPLPVFAEFDNEIAGDLLRKARREAKERNFDRAKRILEEIRNYFFLAPASREIDSVLDSITVFVAEDRSRENYQEAQVLIEAGKYPEALTLLKATEQNFPEVSLAPKIRAGIVKAEIRLAERQEREARELAERQEREAGELFLQGQTLEVEGQYEEALRIYEKVGREFASTSYFERVKPLLTSVRKKIGEEKAGALFARLGDLQPEKDGVEILRIVSLLRTGYGETDLVTGRQSILKALYSRSRGQLSKSKGLEELERGNYELALKNLQEALQMDSGLEEKIEVPLQISHLRVGDKHFQGGNYERALFHYQEYLRLEPAEIALDEDRYHEARYQLGKLEYSRGNFGKAGENLFQVRRFFPERAELFYLLGSIQAREKDYPGALGYLDIAIRLERDNRRFLRKRGLCQLVLTWQLEDGLTRLLADKPGKRGRAFVDTAAAIISGAEAQRIQLELQANPPILRGHRELTPAQIRTKELVPGKRRSHLSEMKAGAANLESHLRQNESRQAEITAKLEKIQAGIIRGRDDLRRAAVLEREIIVPLRKKERLFAQGKEKLELGLTQEIRFVEAKALSVLRPSLRDFERRRPLEGAKRGIRRISDSLFMAQFEDNLREGRELLGEAKAIEISVEEHLFREGTL